MGGGVWIFSGTTHCCTVINGSVKWWLVGHPFLPRADDKQESKVMQGALNPL